MAKRSYPLSKVYGLLEPGPTLLVTTAHKGRANVMTLSWQTMIEFEPPWIACVVSNRNHSFAMLKASRECVLNIPTVELAERVVGCGNSTGAKVDKFARFGLTPEPAKAVGAPLIRECYASLECRVVDASWVAKYCVFVLEVVRAWVDPAVKQPRTLHHQGNGRFAVPGEWLRLPSRMK